VAVRETQWAVSFAVQPEEMNPAGANLDKEEHIQRLQSQRFHCGEITGQQLLLMLARDRPARCCAAGHVRVMAEDMLAVEHVSNGRAPNTIAKLAQFALDFARAPTWVLVFQSARSALQVLPQSAVCLQLADLERSICGARDPDASAAWFQA
jgi:hypothetical protein